MIETKLGDETARLAALKRLEVLDTEPEPEFERIVDLVRKVLKVPIATVSLIDADRQWFKARRGVDACETARDVSFCTHTIEQSQPLIVENATEHPLFADNPLVVGDPYIRAYAGVPLTMPDGYNVGSLCAIDTQIRQFDAEQIAVLQGFANVVVDRLELRQISRTDPLTGAYSRRGFNELAEKEIARCIRTGEPASVALFDIDYFKRVNDTFGHSAGDEVLAMVAQTVGEELRGGDIIGRLGGEEFALLMPRTGQGDALAMCERLRELIAATPVEVEGGDDLTITLSFGIAVFTPDIANPAQWISQADAPLYRAKREGRNRCCMA